MMRLVFRHPTLFSPLVRLLLRHPRLYRSLKRIARGWWQLSGRGGDPAADLVAEPLMRVDDLPPGARQIHAQLVTAIATRRVGRG